MTAIHWHSGDGLRLPFHEATLVQLSAWLEQHPKPSPQAGQPDHDRIARLPALERGQRQLLKCQLEIGG